MDEVQLLPNGSSFWPDLENLGYLKCQYYFPGFPNAHGIPVSLERFMKQVHLKTGGFIMGISGEINTENGCHKKVLLQYRDNSGNLEDICAHIKSVPLLDVIDVMKGKYLPEKVLSCLPSRERELDRTYEKITDSNNQAYVDCLGGYVMSTLSKKCPGFPKFYGHFTGLTPQLKIDITEDFYSIRNEAWFHRGIGSKFKIEVRNEDIGFRSGKQTREIHITDDDFGFTEELKEIAEDPNVIAQEWDEEDRTNEDRITDDITEIYVYNNLELEIDEDYDSEEENNTTDEDDSDDDDSDDENNTTGEDGSDEEGVGGSGDEDSDDEERDDEDDENGGGDCGSGSDGDDEEDEDDESEDDSDYEPDEGVFFAIIPNMPVQSGIYENLEGPIDNLLSDSSITNTEWFAILFQVSFSLAIAQEEYGFIHNDLHTNNIMWVPTDKKNIHYKVHNTIFRVPTFGKIIKIIDYGRSYYKYKGVEYLSDAYKPTGDAAGQYNYPPYYNPKKTRIPPNPSFDLPRLACSIYEGLYDVQHDPKTTLLSSMLNRWLIDSRGKNILWNRNGGERFGGFLLYKHIARHCLNTKPIDELKNNEFKQFITTENIVPDYSI